MLFVLPLLLVSPQIGPAQAYDDAGNPAQASQGIPAPGDILSSFASAAGSNSGAARNGGTIAITNYLDGAAAINLYDATGASLGTVSTSDSTDFGLGYDSVRDLYITTNASSDVVSTFTSAGVPVSVWAAPGSGPVGAAYDSNRDVYWICDWSANTVSSISPVTGATIATFDTAAVGCTRNAGVAFDSANDQVIVGGRDQSAVFVMDAATGALVRSFGAVDGSNNPQGLADSSSGNIWQSSWNSGTMSELDLGNGGAPVLTVSGSCPGVMSISLSGATAGGSVAFVFGTAGSFTIPGGSCAGLVIDVASPTVAGFISADGSGNITLSPSISGGLCGSTIQAVDLASCTASNTAIL